MFIIGFIVFSCSLLFRSRWDELKCVRILAVGCKALKLCLSKAQEVFVVGLEDKYVDMSNVMDRTIHIEVNNEMEMLSTIL